MPRTRGRSVFLTRLWPLLPYLSPSIAWSVSGRYLVVHDVDELLKSLLAAEIVRSSKEASLARQFRLYGFARIRYVYLKQLPELRDLPKKAWVMHHHTLTRESSIDRVQAEVALATFSQPTRTRETSQSDEVAMSPSCTSQAAPNMDIDLDIFPSAQGVVATLPEELAGAPPPPINAQSSVEGFHFDVPSHNAEFLALQQFLEQMEPNEDASPHDSDLTTAENAYLDRLLAGASETNGDAHPGGRERSQLPVAVFQPREPGGTGWQSCEVSISHYASETQSSCMGSGLSTFDSLFQVALSEQASSGPVYWYPPSDRVSAVSDKHLIGL